MCSPEGSGDFNVIRTYREWREGWSKSNKEIRVIIKEQIRKLQNNLSVIPYEPVDCLPIWMNAQRATIRESIAQALFVAKKTQCPVRLCFETDDVISVFASMSIDDAMQRYQECLCRS